MNTSQVPQATQNRLLSDCSIYNLSVKQAVEYIEAYTGVKYSADHVKKLMQEFNKEGYTDEWLKDYTRIGYLIEQRESLDSMLEIKKSLMNKLFALKQKEDFNVKELCLITHSLIELDCRIEELRLGTPILAKLKQKLDTTENDLKQVRQEIWTLKSKQVSTKLN